jgi:hypothetical protein
MKEYQWFLTWLSVLPGSLLAISLHLWAHRASVWCAQAAEQVLLVSVVGEHYDAAQAELTRFCELTVTCLGCALSKILTCSNALNANAKPQRALQARGGCQQAQGCHSCRHKEHNHRRCGRTLHTGFAFASTVDLYMRTAQDSMQPAISDANQSSYLLPRALWASDMMRSSSSVQGFLLMRSSRWLW